MDKKTLLGRIFISYSSKDKAFVRKLTKRIESQGYIVWLDEKELIAGDYLPKKIGEAIEKSRVSIVIVSNNSLESGWVQHEISNALDHMIKGKMRLIPILTQDVKLPPELGGLVFADFRESFHHGLKQVLNALDHETSKYDLRRITKEPTFSELIEDILKETFDSIGNFSSFGEYKSWDIKYIMLGDTEIWYEIASSYGNKWPLSQQWWDEFSEAVSDWGIHYVLLITERPVALNVAEPLEQLKDNIFLKKNKRQSQYLRYVSIYRSYHRGSIEIKHPQ
jgi:hypothetical protein